MRALARFCASFLVGTVGTVGTIGLIGAVTGVAAIGCHHSQVWHSQPIATQYVRIEPTSVMASGERLFVETMLYNTSPETLLVDRDSVTLSLADGRTLARSSGTTSLHQPYVVPPNAAHKVYVDFRAEGFQWRDVSAAQVNFTGALTIRGQIVAVPPMYVSPNLMVAPPRYAPGPAPQPTYYAPPPPPPATNGVPAAAPQSPGRDVDAPRRPR